MNNFISLLESLPTPEEMRQWDINAINFGIPENMLMENASRACLSLINDLSLLNKGDIVWLFIGSGNNGGDGAALSRHLHDEGKLPIVFHIAPLAKLKGSAALHANLALKDGVEFYNLKMKNINFISMMAFLQECVGKNLPRPALIVDALLGTGFAGELRPDMESLVNVINKLSSVMNTPIFAIDSPSGLNCVTGRPQPVAIKATYTLTLAAAKPGLVLPHADKWTGQLFCRKIGFPKSMNQPYKFKLLDGESLLKETGLPQNSYKNLFGHVYIIGGSQNMTGAPRLAALGALRTGAGLVTLVGPEQATAATNTVLPEVMTISLGNEHTFKSLPDNIKTVLQNASSLVIGPGMGRSSASLLLLQSILEIEARPPTVFDADSLFLLGQHRKLLNKIKKTDVLTPHPGEAGFLLQQSGKEIQQDRFKALYDLTRIVPAVIVLKGACTLIGQTEKDVLICPYDIPQLAVAGAGDVLSGCAGALLGKPEFMNDALGACAKAVILHTMSGFMLAGYFPERGMLASDIANAIPKVHDFIINLTRQNKIIGRMPWPVFA